MIKLIRQRILLEFDDIFEYKMYLERYLKKGYTFIQSSVGETIWFEVEKCE